MIKKALFLILCFVCFFGISFSIDYDNACDSEVPSGIHTMINDVSNHDGSCYTINVDDVIFDCQGHTIGGDGDVIGYGIHFISQDNITIKNCIIQDFSRNLYFNTGNNIRLENITSLNSNGTGMYLMGITNLTLTESFHDGSVETGIAITSGSSNVLVNSTISKHSGYDNLWLYITENVTIRDFEAYNGSQEGIVISNSNNVVLRDSYFYNNSGRNILLNSDPDNRDISLYNVISESARGTGLEDGADNTIVEGFISLDSLARGIFAYGSNSTYNNVVSYRNQRGLDISNSFNLTLNDFEILNSTLYGIYAFNAEKNYLSNFIIENSNSYGIYIGGAEAKNNTFYNFDARNNTNYNLYISSGANNTFYGSYFENVSKVYNPVDNQFYFNSGSGLIGNFWNDFNCNESVSRGGVLVCIDPANYTLDVGNSIYDLAPLNSWTSPAGGAVLNAGGSTPSGGSSSSSGGIFPFGNVFVGLAIVFIYLLF